MNDDDQAIDFFRQHIAGASRALPLKDARLFLKGFLLLTDDQRREVDDLRETYTDICIVDDKLGSLAAPPSNPDRPEASPSTTQP